MSTFAQLFWISNVPGGTKLWRKPELVRRATGSGGVQRHRLSCLHRNRQRTTLISGAIDSIAVGHRALVAGVGCHINAFAGGVRHGGPFGDQPHGFSSCEHFGHSLSRGFAVMGGGVAAHDKHHRHSCQESHDQTGRLSMLVNIMVSIPYRVSCCDAGSASWLRPIVGFADRPWSVVVGGLLWGLRRAVPPVQWLLHVRNTCCRCRRRLPGRQRSWPSS